MSRNVDASIALPCYRDRKREIVNHIVMIEKIAHDLTYVALTRELA